MKVTTRITRSIEWQNWSIACFESNLYDQGPKFNVIDRRSEAKQMKQNDRVSQNECTF